MYRKLYHFFRLQISVFSLPWRDASALARYALSTDTNEGTGQRLGGPSLGQGFQE